MYRYGIYPLHSRIFGGMLRAVARRAESCGSSVTGATGFIGYEVARQLAEAARALFFSRLARGRGLMVESDCLWSELGLEPRLPTIVTGIPAALDESVAFRWVHPVEDPKGW